MGRGGLLAMGTALVAGCGGGGGSGPAAGVQDLWEGTWVCDVAIQDGRGATSYAGGQAVTVADPGEGPLIGFALVSTRDAADWTSPCVWYTVAGDEAQVTSIPPGSECSSPGITMVRGAITASPDGQSLAIMEEGTDGADGSRASLTGQCTRTGASASTAPAAPGQDGGSGVSGAGTFSCVLEKREVEHCGGESPLTAWSPSCKPGPCPVYIDRGQQEYADLSESSATGTCSSNFEYRSVGDFQGSCDDWSRRGQPLTPPSQAYCGHSLLYNEFDDGSGHFGACSDCLSAHCALEYAACDPMTRPACDGLIRCLRECTPGNTAAADACFKSYPDAAAAANAFVSCASAACAAECL